ncbi:hypothetical protein H6G81_15865 [Scytonema hofmannii FACHB-248]|uniref:Uncharacterized protein n=1 Tax=Scytonema hofmannii FACHB-248 TaxID=1842502 RepID=A0ABR8GR74_9CYAN|nr:MULTISPECIES: hypothetical protein [Nostocales]MBD2605957.1 hypothetical protein [Scytonema hofmannii FACHB-248]
MSYPVVLYPKLLVDFIADNPIPPTVEPGVGVVNVRSGSVRVAQSLPLETSKKMMDARTVEHQNSWFFYPCIVMGYASLMVLNILGVFGDWGWMVLGGGAIGSGFKLYQLLKADINRFFSNSSTKKSVSEHPTHIKGEKLSVPQVVNREDLKQRQFLQQRLKKLKLTLHNRVRKPDGVSDAPIGASEAVFKQVLERHFPGRVQTQLRFPIDGTEYSYSIDFAILFDEIGLAIDCEIDEPYAYNSRKPTHCVDQPQDSQRNSFFLEGNWMVIRFAEEQVVRYPESCCKQIATALALIIGAERYQKNFQDVRAVPRMQQWTKRQASKMAKSKYRERYLAINGFT